MSFVMGKKILVTDDEKEIREFLRSFFDERGYSVVVAGTQADAIELLEQEKPHVALLDIRMGSPRDGLEILSWIKQRKLKVKTIMITGVENQEIIEEAYKLGADDYITKPLSLEYLQTSVSEKIANLTGKESTREHP